MRAATAIRIILLGIVIAGGWGCSKANEGTPTLNSAGKHPSGWIVAGTGGDHPAVYVNSPAQCLQCHGNDLRGGISGVSCFSATQGGISCHPGGPGQHPADFANPANHGSRAKAAAGGANGFAYCENCHGTSFTGGPTPAGTISASCVACHGVAAPHPPKPWRGGTFTHTNTDQSNAVVCAQCHTAGQNLSTPILSSYASGTPGCFNSTLCHGVTGHANDPRQPWASPDNHGAAAKGDPAAGNGLMLCTSCHGTNYAGNSFTPSCFSCHQTAPHSPAPWRRTISTPTARTHTTTNVANAKACAGCHQGNQRLTTPVAVTGNPGCFDNSMCHGATGHNDTSLFPVPTQAWNSPVNHGAKAKASPSAANSGFSYCRNCHGSGSASDPLFKGGKALTSCMNVLGCHGLTNNAPHPAAPWRGSTAAGSTGHPTTDTGNAAICAICHTGGANSSRAPQPSDLIGNTGCFNATMCHGITGHSDTTVYPAPWSSPTNHGAFARTDPSVGPTKGFAYCQHCHGTDFSGGNAQQSCYPCHGVSAPHPAKADWTLAAGTLSHVNTGEGNAAICVACHNATTKNLSTSPINYQARFAPAGSFNTLATPGCFNGSLCHADIKKTSNCNVCHGPLSTTQFNSLAGVMDPTDAAVGAHIPHLDASIQTVPLSANIACSECHTVPTAPGIAGLHRNGTVNITFGTLATTGSSPSVSRDGATGALVCANTYCHGATLIGGSNKTPRWNDISYLSSSGCGTCHGYPPSTSIHTGKSPTDCIGCHSHVNSSGTGFSDPSKHIDGTIEATGGHTFPYPGSLHNAAAGTPPFSGCVTAGCHATGTASSTYPVAAGTPPNCRGCHTKAAPIGDTTRCDSCHGSSTNGGQPTGTTFPDIAGRHSDHSGIACSECHGTAGTGQTTHGPSNRTAHNDANVVVQFPAGFTFNRTGDGHGTCSGTCHGENHPTSPLRSW